MRKPLTTTAMIAATLVVTGCATPFYMGQQPTVLYGRDGNYMAEDIRASISSISIEAGSLAPTLYVGGDYGAETLTAGEGAAAGAAGGVLATGEMVGEDPRAIILVPIILPVAIVAGSVTGAAAAKIKQQVQKFRDGQTEEMLDDAEFGNPNTELAQNFEESVRAVDDVDVVDADQADALLIVTLKEIGVIVNGNDAEISATAGVLLKDPSGRVLFMRDVDYWDKDTLSNWTANDNALWKQFTINAHRHIARVASERMFEAVTTRHVLRPTDNDWSGMARSKQPVLTWDFVLLGGDSFDDTDIADNPILFDIEIYDGSRVVYSAQDVAGMSHEVAGDLPRCRTLSWTVRPIFEIGGQKRAGEWMRQANLAERLSGHQPWSYKREFWKGFAEIKTGCGR